MVLPPSLPILSMALEMAQHYFKQNKLSNLKPGEDKLGI